MSTICPQYVQFCQFCAQLQCSKCSATPWTGYSLARCMDGAVPIDRPYGTICVQGMPWKQAEQVGKGKRFSNKLHQHMPTCTNIYQHAQFIKEPRQIRKAKPAGFGYVLCILIAVEKIRRWRSSSRKYLILSGSMQDNLSRIQQTCMSVHFLNLLLLCIATRTLESSLNVWIHSCFLKRCAHKLLASSYTRLDLFEGFGSSFGCGNEGLVVGLLFELHQLADCDAVTMLCNCNQQCLMFNLRLASAHAIASVPRQSIWQPCHAMHAKTIKNMLRKMTASSVRTKHVTT